MEEGRFGGVGVGVDGCVLEEGGRVGWSFGKWSGWGIRWRWLGGKVVGRCDGCGNYDWFVPGMKESCGSRVVG
jgi:hypothetical protein